MENDENLHRLEGITDQKGGLIVKKKTPTFKVPQPSLLGLDRLAAAKRKEKEEAARKMSFTMDDDDSADDSSASVKEKQPKDSRKFRAPHSETPTYTGGISEEARERLIERLNSNKNKEKGVYATTKDRHRSGDSKHHDRDRDRHHESSSRRSKTPRFRDEPKTPNLGARDEIAKSSWDDDDDFGPSRKSSWDFPTPSSYKGGGGDWSERSTKSRRHEESRRSKESKRRKYEDESARFTPAHRYNAWAKDRRRSGATPGKEGGIKWDDTVDREMWEEEQKRIDREWYNMDEGYDDGNNPFSSVSEEYTKKKEEQLEQRKKKRLSAQQRQINKDNELWERNRMLTSGAVHSIDFSEDYDEESIDRVHLLVHNIVPPFLDGRIVFTKQPEPVIPVRDPTSDMAIVSRKGSHLVRVYREQKERKKAQKKHWELSGTKIGNIMGIKKKEDEEDKRFNKDDDTADYKTDQKFAEHMKSSEASSDFARKKTILEQRRYLPVFAVRQELLNVIRENSGVIIVGKTDFYNLSPVIN
jgi:pre-mRNA-splicing factor ATP-dependent RNA helicase DHX38/PRP16